jgi:hypothetical protein
MIEHLLGIATKEMNKLKEPFPKLSSCLTVMLLKWLEEKML